MKSSTQLIREYGEEIDRTVKARTPERTAYSIYNEAFPPSRPKRSEEYKEGVFRHLRYRMMEVSDCKCPYPDGSVGADAFWAGVSESWQLLEKHGCDRRK